MLLVSCSSLPHLFQIQHGIRDGFGEFFLTFVHRTSLATGRGWFPVVLTSLSLTGATVIVLAVINSLDPCSVITQHPCIVRTAAVSFSIVVLSLQHHRPTFLLLCRCSPACRVNAPSLGPILLPLTSTSPAFNAVADLRWCCFFWLTVELLLVVCDPLGSLFCIIFF